MPYPIARITLSLHLPGGSIVSLRGPMGIKRLCPDYVAGSSGHHDIEFKVSRAVKEKSLLLVIETPKPSRDPSAHDDADDASAILSDMDMSLIRVEVRPSIPAPGTRGVRRGT